MLTPVTQLPSRELAREMGGQLSHALEELPWPKLNGYYMNSLYMFEHLKLALQKYGETGKLEEKVPDPEGIIFYGKKQPDTVGGIFTLALDKKNRGGFQDTIEAIIARPVVEKDLEVAELGKKILKLLSPKS